MDKQITQDNFRSYLYTFIVESSLDPTKVAYRLKVKNVSIDLESLAKGRILSYGKNIKALWFNVWHGI